MPLAQFVALKLESPEDSACEFQTKILHYDSERTVYFEFSCGCVFKVDRTTSISLRYYTFYGECPVPCEIFLETYNAALEKFFKTTIIRKEKSLWKRQDFKKTTHRFCPADPDFYVKMHSMMTNSEQDIIKAFPVLPLYWNELTVFWRSLCHQKKLDFIWTVWCTIFLNTSTMPVEMATIRKSRRLPKKAKEALQIVESLDENPTQTDELVPLFADVSVNEKKKKQKKKNPNKGKAPNAIRKSQKPARL
ncbi:Oidioi.mRNA.OKI2018_I69.PAR.g12674.t1.cds [Oikopleura dioica]|uniref:Oidioi.mRNA.OKI2018_I69.PAR.g12674.t1.cds n=1 Tax=Oikopleura dioica TaxID=34765 RepID=A0ABN7S133_OIKDI|nr:Oidioi.mRNA.OKI2018_I69.PAR.g12674.t1.cds [Oikopleura dioica]